MRTIRVNLDKNSYDITFDNSLTAVKELMAKYNKVVLVTDENVNRIYGKTFEGLVSAKLVLPAGERTKSQENLFWLYDRFIEAGVTRTDLIVAFGGGVIGDLTGFAASTFMRGIDYVQVPTTLLAQVDSSVGGKTAIDLPKAKNIVGSFYQPKAVFINTDFLKTLPSRIYSDGMAEVIKYGVIRDSELFDMLGESTLDHQEIVYRCCDIKRIIVEHDQFDKGERMLLNFGHTLGHVVEQFYNYKKYTHGEAVAIGMYTVTMITEAMGITAEGTAIKIKQLLGKFRLPCKMSVSPAAVMNTMRLDKKAEGTMLNLIAAEDIGSSKIIKLSQQEILNSLKNLR